MKNKTLKPKNSNLGPDQQTKAKNKPFTSVWAVLGSEGVRVSSG